MTGPDARQTDAPSTAGKDAVVVLVLCLVLVPALLVAGSVPLIPLGLAIGLGYVAVRWPIEAGWVPRVVTALAACVALLSAATGFLA